MNTGILITAHLSLLACAVLLPIFSAYLLTFSALLVLACRAARRRDLSAAGGNNAAGTTRLLLRSTLVMAASFAVASLVCPWQSEFSPGLGAELKKCSHFLVKYALLPWVLVTYVRWQSQRKPGVLVKPLQGFAMFLALYALYCILQRYTGVDWARGSDARLGSGRFDHGVFRISGMMSHPLTLAYNLVAVGVFWLAVMKGKFAREKVWFWRVGLISVVVVLFLSGSRLPFVIFLCCLAAMNWRITPKAVFLQLGMAFAAAVMLVAEGNFLGRIMAAFSGSWAQRLDNRPYFWEAHWRMFLDHPWAGVGHAGYESALRHYYGLIGYHDKMYPAHNIFIQTLADSGLLGFAGLMAFLGALAAAAWREWRRGGLMLAAGLLFATAGGGLLQNVLRDSEYVYAAWVCIVFFANLADAEGGHGRTVEQPAHHEPGAG